MAIGFASNSIFYEMIGRWRALGYTVWDVGVVEKWLSCRVYLLWWSIGLLSSVMGKGVSAYVSQGAILIWDAVLL